MYVIPVLISIVAWLASFLYLNQATMGVGAVAAACWFAILARIIQQDSHHRALMKVLRDGGGIEAKRFPSEHESRTSFTGSPNLPPT